VQENPTEDVKPEIEIIKKKSFNSMSFLSELSEELKTD
jgi:hypothetical protein